MTRLAVVIVSWNTRDVLRQCLCSLRVSLVDSGVECLTIVVDNASVDGTPAMLRAEFPDVMLIEAGRNLGFAGGNNLALRRLLCRSSAHIHPNDPIDNSQGIQDNYKPQLNFLYTDYVLLLNPDTEIVGNAIPHMLHYMEEHPGVDVVGPQLRYPDGSAQPSRRRFPTRGTFFWESTPLERYWPTNPWVRCYRCVDRSDAQEQYVDWLVGAVLLVRRTAIERAGLLDAGFTMYSEELEWQQRIQATKSTGQSAPVGRSVSRDGAIVYLPDALVIHHEGKSSEQALARRYLNFQRSRLRYARMVYGDYFAMVLRFFLRACYIGELVIEAAKWVLGHKRGLRAQRVLIYWRVVWGLGRESIATDE